MHSPQKSLKTGWNILVLSCT